MYGARGYNNGRFQSDMSHFVNKNQINHTTAPLECGWLWKLIERNRKKRHLLVSIQCDAPITTEGAAMV